MFLPLIPFSKNERAATVAFLKMRATNKRKAQQAQLDDDGASRRLYKGTGRGAARVGKGMLKNLRTNRNREHLPHRSGDMLPRDMRGKYLNSMPTSLFQGGANVDFSRGIGADNHGQMDAKNWETYESARIAPANLYIENPQIRRITEAALKRVNYAPMLQQWEERNSKLAQQPILQRGTSWLTSDNAAGSPFEPYVDGDDQNTRNQLGLFAASKSGFGKNRGLSVIRSVFMAPMNSGTVVSTDPDKDPSSYSVAVKQAVAESSSLTVNQLNEVIATGGTELSRLLKASLAGIVVAALGPTVVAGGVTAALGYKMVSVALRNMGVPEPIVAEIEQEPKLKALVEAEVNKAKATGTI